MPDNSERAKINQEIRDALVAHLTPDERLDVERLDRDLNEKLTKLQALLNQEQLAKLEQIAMEDFNEAWRRLNAMSLTPPGALGVMWRVVRDDDGRHTPPG